jgi:hypothetical protein
MRRTRLAAGALALGVAAAGAIGVTQVPASADVVVCGFVQYGPTLGCPSAPAPAFPAGTTAVGVGNEVVPAAPDAPQVSQTYVCVYENGTRSCTAQTLGVPIIFSTAAGLT